MKWTLLFFLLAFAANGYAQSDTTLKKYALIYTPGPGWDTTKQAHQQLHFDKHSQFLSTMRKEKKILFGARFSDKGFLIVEARNDEEMRSMLKNDLMTVNQIFTATFYRLSVFYDGCISR